VIPEIDIWRAAQLMLNSWPLATTTGRPCGAGSLPPSPNSRIRPRPAECTDRDRRGCRRRDLD